ncbi:GNAT family N-acetyltransferase [Hazenella coriacea]|uniref:Acetyltransferase (GNAT) family protein n=1 Tax=Hazenella coriacea TaxID=1179467 RepID=A0A4R3LC70_9BACL|nr:GNAT family N-acetyltransferase [Hazenella coriacea]TCS96860.1 hypothetical protein EDD58_101505 [Hazenella coriacea]
MNNVQLYDATQLHQLDWPEDIDGQYARAYLTPLMTEGTQTYINNVNTQLLALQLHSKVMPVTVNQAEYDNSYVCSPITHYITYAIEELYNLKKPRLEGILKRVLQSLEMILRWGQMNKVLIVNNWLLSTNLYLPLSEQEIHTIIETLTKSYPNHAICFRSISSYPVSLQDHFITNGFLPIPSRQVYLYYPNQFQKIASKKRWILKKDLKFLAQSDYEVLHPEQITAKDIPRFVDLYNQLYLDKYSKHNPQFNERFISLALKHRLLHLRAFRKEGKIDAVLGYFVRHQAMTTPVFGYDTQVPLQAGLYRLLSAQLIRESHQSGNLLHQSSGAAEFKRCRGAIPHLEYTMAYVNHLPRDRQFIWKLLHRILHQIAVPLLEKHKL